ncbi:MAG: AAA family ATPase [Candidatus Bipolaricaulota bacterium]|nr:AAA family ATPase [Candidatus Bipolaricaulota bacterium]MDW8152132.1 ATP-binding protein [Candidatus Bipolaricaulota bacterium]
MIERLPPEKLRRTCDPRLFTFATTAELKPLQGIVGQERALEALRVGLSLRAPKHRYNVYVAGEPGLGKTSAVTQFLEELSRGQPVPPDICYVHNFALPHVPRYLLLPPGRGRELRQDMERFIEFLERELPRVMESEEVKARLRREREQLEAQKEEVFRELEGRVRALGFALQRTPFGLNTIPLKPDGSAFSHEEFQALPEEEKAGILRRQGEIQELVRQAFQRVGELEESWQERHRRVVQEATRFLIAPRLAQLRAKYAGIPRVLEFLEAVQEDVVLNAEAILAGKGKPPLPLPLPEPDRFLRYRVNVLVDRSGLAGAPVVVEENATYINLFGTIERRVQFGIVTTDFTQIRAGALHRANGGYLVLSALNLLRFPLSWEALKIALKTGEIRVEDPAQMLGYASTEGLRPEPVPLQVKVILLGPLWLYYLLYFYDEDFRKLFTVRADFDTEMPWTEEAAWAVARFIRARELENPEVLPFSPEGVARVVEYAAELAGDQRKLSTRFAALTALVEEASFWARRQGAAVVGADHVRLAIEKGRSRQSLLADKVREWIRRGKFVVRVDGAAVGQVNGLAVVDLGDFAFGRPQRVTANVFAGKAGVVDIEREAELGGKIHTKGVMILKSYFGEKFAVRAPLTLSATLAMEQAYSGIEGDSASAAELCALLSALAGVPFRQGIAVTGAIDQKGNLQPVGGVNEKIYGHFLVCKELGLTGEQGVVIPRRNADELMLPEEVVEAVRAGKFHVWACDTVEEVAEILSGMPAGQPDPQGTYPEGTLFHLVQKRLEEIRARVEEAEGAEDAG